MNEIHALEQQIKMKKKVYESINLSTLPDRGARFLEQIESLEAAISKLQIKSESERSPEPKPEIDGANTRIKYACIDSDVVDFAQSEKVPSNPSNISDKLVKVDSCKASQTQVIKALPLPSHIKPDSFASRSTNMNLCSSWSLHPSHQLIKEALTTMHSSLEDCPAPEKEASEPHGLKSQLKPHQRQALSWMVWRESKHPHGGVLADDMGLGKTLTMIALMLKHRTHIKAKGSRNKDDKTVSPVKVHTTLVVCPASLIHQWADEIEKHCKSGSLKVLVYHGDKRKTTLERLMEYDVIITTYNILNNEVGSSVSSEKKKLNADKENKDNDADSCISQFLQLRWYRLILDEAHTIKNPKSITSTTVCAIHSKYRWAVTGTPIHNELNDMYSIIRFLHFTPFNDAAVWKQWVKQQNAVGRERLNVLVKSILLRRTKDQLDSSGKPMIELPKKQIKTHKLTLATKEKDIYEKILSITRSTLVDYFSNKEKDSKRENGDSPKEQKSAVKIVGQKPSGSLMLVLILRLQQCCSHLSLLQKPKVENANDSVLSIQDDDIVSMMSNLKLSPTAPENINQESQSATCSNQPVTDLNFLGLKEYQDDPDFKKSALSTKLKCLLEELDNLKKKTAENKSVEKCVIVSQWTSMLEIIAIHLKKLGFKCHVIDGTVKPDERIKLVKDFNDNPVGAEVMLLSLRAGGVGLNLVGGNHLFLMDSHWNPALEQQATDRVYRIGQTKDVVIHRFLCENTIEEKIQDMQKAKQNLAVDILEGAKKKHTKLSLGDLRQIFNV